MLGLEPAISIRWHLDRAANKIHHDLDCHLGNEAAWTADSRFGPRQPGRLGAPKVPPRCPREAGELVDSLDPVPRMSTAAPAATPW